MKTMNSDGNDIPIPADVPVDSSRHRVDVPLSTCPPSMYREKLEESSQEIAAKWLELYQTSPAGIAMRAIKEQIRLFAPMIYSPMKDCDCLNLSYDEELTFKKLFGPMELFLSGLEKTDTFFKKLEALEPPATLCGRVFKLGEPTYCCRDCGMDPTCVLCVDCFRASAHKHHKYKITTSGGGGYCDCGDPEAWKTNCFCDKHIPHTVGESGNAIEDSDLEDIQKRALTLFSFVLEFCHEILTSELHTILPRDLNLFEKDIELLNISCPSDTFATVLYNDEMHTFDTVIQTLTRAVDCSKRTAEHFAIMIDREGRSIVKCSTFQVCNQVKQVIERFTTKNGSGRSLKVTVMQSYAIAYQTFAMQLLRWIQKLINLSSYYRQAFCTAITAPREKSDTAPASSILEGVMKGDVHLWKAVRSLWHHLCISGLLKEYETKKNFAVTFSKLYSDLMKDYIYEDDHEHSCSITSLSVQIFTVPTIAHYLIAKEDIFAKIVTTFNSECGQRLNSDGVLEFDRHLSMLPFKRACYCTTDLKYILTMPPSVWDEGLRRGFLHGLSVFLTLLSWMENMDSVVRQTLQHMEYEPEWESGFNLHIRLSPVISLALDWCGSDKTVLMFAYRKTMHELSSIYGKDKARQTLLREFANHSATCIDYDVSRQPVSVHKPLSRFLAGLYLHLEKYNLDFFNSELNIDGRLPPEVLIEPALRTQVLVGQVHANMWRRNGFALLNQMYFYHNVKFRSDMLDKDIISLQMGAAIIESNEFVLHVLDRYGLFQWINASSPLDVANEDDTQRNNRYLAEEFLHLIIVLFSARYTVGVGQVTRDDCIKKEVIQQLCIEPMTHSNLNKALVENVNQETGLETVIDQVAVFKKQSTQNGVSLYELKEEYYEEYDCFHYHYTREEQSKAEQKQQLRKKSKGEPEFCPPPKLPLFTSSFNMVVNILKSDVLLEVLNLILKREINLLQHRRNVGRGLDASGVAFSDPQIQKVLHLICLGLNEEIVRNEKDPGHFFRFFESAKSHGIFRSLEDYSKIAVNTSHVEMVRHILKLCEIACPPQQVEELPKDIQVMSNTKEEEERQKKAKLAAESRMKMLAKISAAQKSFMAVNADLFADEEATGGDMGEVCGVAAVACDRLQALGRDRTPSNFAHEEIHICILCQEEQSLSDLSKPFVLAAYVQRSSVFCQDRTRLMLESDNDQGSFLQERDPLFLGPDLMYAPVVSCCGHMMHISCWNKHYENVLAKERRRPYRHPMSFDVDKREYLCPMCDCISNVVIPMTNPLFKLYSFPTSKKHEVPGPFDVWIEGMQVFGKERLVCPETLPTSERGSLHSSFIPEECSFARRYDSCNISHVMSKLSHRETEFEIEVPTPPCRASPPKFTDNFQERVNNFMQMVYSVGLDTRMDLNDCRLPLMLWQGLSFSIIALEEYSRDQKQPFFGNDVPSRRELGLTHYIRTCALGTLQYYNAHPEVIRSHAVKLLTTLVTSPSELPCVLECDAFAMLINLTQALPAINPETDPSGYIPSTGTITDFYICRLTFLFHITQVLIVKDFSEFIRVPEESVEVERSDASSSSSDNGEMLGEKESISSPPIMSRMEHLISEVWRCVGKPVPKNANVDYSGVWNSIRESVIPFLRCCCKFYEKLTGIAVPETLTTSRNSFDDLVQYLGLPTSFEKLFDSRICWQLPYRWARHPGVVKLLSPSVQQRPEDNRRVAIVTYPRRRVELTPLPHDYIELMNSVSTFTCSLGDMHDSRTPTMCLICGVTLCSQSYCCQFELGGSKVGACTHHAYYCGGGKGIFLRIRDCKLFYIGGKGKGCFMLPPYVDEYGETDQGLKRGNPMTLDVEKYEQLRRSWMLHLIPEEIARIVENSTSISTIEWQNL